MARTKERWRPLGSCVSFAVAPAVQWWLRGSLDRQLPAMPATPLPAGLLVRRWVNAEALKIMVKSTALKRTAKIVCPRLWSGCGWAKRCALAVWRRIEPLESSGARTLLVEEHSVRYPVLVHDASESYNPKAQSPTLREHGITENCSTWLRQKWFVVPYGIPLRCRPLPVVSVRFSGTSDGAAIPRKGGVTEQGQQQAHAM